MPWVQSQLELYPQHCISPISRFPSPLQTPFTQVHCSFYLYMAGIETVARESLGDPAGFNMTTRHTSPRGCGSSTAYGAPILREFPPIPPLVQKGRQISALEAAKLICVQQEGRDVLQASRSTSRAWGQPAGTRKLPSFCRGWLRVFETGTLQRIVLSRAGLGCAPQLCAPQRSEPNSGYFQHVYFE